MALQKLKSISKLNYPIVVKEITAPCIVHTGKDFYIRAFPLNHTKVCVGYTLEEADRPGEFHPDKARELGVPCGPLWSDLQKGFEVTTPDGKVVKPEEVMGEKRSGRRIDSGFCNVILFRRLRHNTKNKLLRSYLGQ